jgi:hypothetical protein
MRLLAALVLGILGLSVPHGALAEAVEPRRIDCPATAGRGTRCVSGQDDNGAWYVAAVPPNWNRRLIVHAHGGPRTGAPEATDPLEDLDRFSVMVRHGYAWIGSTYRRGGYGVRMAAEDTDNSRKIFWSLYGRPDRTLLHGQSWGGNVAAKASELHIGSAESGWNYDGVLITNGIVSGGTRAYGFRADLRAVYQYYCANHPAADEPAYPVWQGLPLDSRMTRAELRRRIETCTGVDRPADRRTPDQAARLRDILAVTGVAEAQLVSHMTWATFLFQDMVLLRLDGRNPFDNSATVYSGSSDDAALNAGVQRFSADPEGVAMLAHDADLSGQITRPTLTLHALHDPTVSVAVEAIYAATVSAAGRSEWLVQVVTDESDHSKLSDASYMTALDALEGWIDRGLAPDPASFQARCGTNWVRQGPCLFIAP